MHCFNKKINRRHTGSIKWDCQRNPDAIPFWIADSDYKTDKNIIKALSKRVKHGAFGYTAENEEFNQTVTDWYNKQYNTHVVPSDIIPTIGVMTSIMVALKTFTKENDEIVVQTPVYHCFFRVINNSKRAIIENPLIKTYHDDHTITYKMDLDHLETLFKKGVRTMILCSPHNPIGRVWSRNEIKDLLVLVKKYEVLLITDEIHSDFMIDGNIFYTMANELDNYNRIIICNAPSKSFNIAGLQTSYIITRNKDIQESFRNYMEENFIEGPNLLGITALLAGYTKGSKYIACQNEHLTKNYHLVKKALNANLPKAYLSNLEGTYLLFIDLSYLGKTSDDLVTYLEDHQLTFNSGTDFKEVTKGCIRVNLACSTYQLTTGINMLIEAVKELENAAR